MSLFTAIADLFGVTAPSTLELIFMTCALLGTVFFVLLMALMLLGDILGGVVDTAFDTDFSIDSDLAFEIFSIQGMSAAVMMFGYVGMFTVTSEYGDFSAVLAGGFAASLSMYGVAKMMQGIRSMAVEGTLDYKNAIGEHGSVHLRIKPGESGEVQITVQGGMRTLGARAKDESLHIPTGDFIEVVDVIGSTLIVQPLSKEE